MTARAASPSDTFRTVDSVPIHFARQGSGRPVVLIHGASGNLNDMTFRLAPMLAGRHDVVAFDRPGHGLSGLPPGGGLSINAQAALLRGAVAQLGIVRPIVVGHSYGGSVALAWAVDAPESMSALVLLAAPSHLWEGDLGATNELLASPVTGPPIAWAAPHLVTRSFAEKALAGVFEPQSPPEGYLDHLDLSLVLQPASLRENARQLVALKDDLRPMIPSYPDLADAGGTGPRRSRPDGGSRDPFRPAGQTGPPGPPDPPLRDRAHAAPGGDRRSDRRRRARSRIARTSARQSATFQTGTGEHCLAPVRRLPGPGGRARPDLLRRQPKDAGSAGTAPAADRYSAAAACGERVAPWRTSVPSTLRHSRMKAASAVQPLAETIVPSTKASVGDRST